MSGPQPVVLRPVGDLDTVAAPGLRRQLQEHVDAGAQLVIVDMTAVHFLDSAGLSALVGVYRSLPPGQQIALANVPARMQRALRICAVGTLFTVHEQGEPWPWPDVRDMAQPS